jgi:hypothetical protein
MVTSLDPGTYRVRVLGKVSKKLPYLKDLSITFEEHKDYGTLTVISGEFTDQEALFELLYGLSKSNISVLSLERLKPDK